MNIEEYFESGEHKQMKGHFANLVSVAISDGVIGEKEEKLLQKLAKQLHISDVEFNEIMSGEHNFPFSPPVMKEDRYGRFINLIRMITVDDVISDFELRAMYRFAAGLDIPSEKVQTLIDQSSIAIHEGLSNDEIIEKFDKWMKS